MVGRNVEASKFALIPKMWKQRYTQIYAHWEVRLRDNRYITSTFAGNYEKLKRLFKSRIESTNFYFLKQHRLIQIDRQELLRNDLQVTSCVFHETIFFVEVKTLSWPKKTLQHEKSTNHNQLLTSTTQLVIFYGSKKTRTKLKVKIHLRVENVQLIVDYVFSSVKGLNFWRNF